MVSSQNPSNSPSSEEVIGVIRSDRGFVPAEAPTVPAPGVSPQYLRMPLASQTYYFWGAVIAGSLLTLSVFVLSWLLMLGCHVGVTRAGLLSMGAGAAWWTMITSCIAFFFGGSIAAHISRPMGSGWLKGAAVWALSIPLALCICAILSTASGLLATSTAPHVNIVESANNLRAVSGQIVYTGISFGAIWTGFWTLLAGLVFSIIGSSSVFGPRTYFGSKVSETVVP